MHENVTHCATKTNTVVSEMQVYMYIVLMIFIATSILYLIALVMAVKTILAQRPIVSIWFAYHVLPTKTSQIWKRDFPAAIASLFTPTTIQHNPLLESPKDDRLTSQPSRMILRDMKSDATLSSSHEKMIPGSISYLHLSLIMIIHDHPIYTYFWCRGILLSNNGIGLGMRMW